MYMAMSPLNANGPVLKKIIRPAGTVRNATHSVR
jgi:hypothetical protein